MTAAYSGTSQIAPATGEDDIVVGKAATSTRLTVTAASLVATVAAVPPGAGAPNRLRHVCRRRTPLGNAPLSPSGDGHASQLLPGGQDRVGRVRRGRVVRGVLGVDRDQEPEDHRQVTSAHPKNRIRLVPLSGNHQFTCMAGFTVTGPCPAPVTLSRAAPPRRPPQRSMARTEGSPRGRVPDQHRPGGPAGPRVTGVDELARRSDAPGPAQARLRRHRQAVRPGRASASWGDQDHRADWLDLDRDRDRQGRVIYSRSTGKVEPDRLLRGRRDPHRGAGSSGVTVRQERTRSRRTTLGHVHRAEVRVRGSGSEKSRTPSARR